MNDLSIRVALKTLLLHHLPGASVTSLSVLLIGRVGHRPCLQKKRKEQRTDVTRTRPSDDTTTWKLN
ncbi:unnamed protein product [Pleuronectes platessa]|uniref:Uncharacterized protein n=1 Tax=Pleuronectes platessa TaxID=8262 RepID=A0A9N7YDF4_PLEPL|nr:unnamed protein product [Pleuronectes platessa]